MLLHFKNPFILTVSEDVNASMYCFIFLSLPVDKPICAFIYTYMYTYIYTHTPHARIMWCTHHLLEKKANKLDSLFLKFWHRFQSASWFQQFKRWEKLLRSYWINHHHKEWLTTILPVFPMKFALLLLWAFPPSFPNGGRRITRQHDAASGHFFSGSVGDRLHVCTLAHMYMCGWLGPAPSTAQPVGTQLSPGEAHIPSPPVLAPAWPQHTASHCAHAALCHIRHSWWQLHTHALDY